MIVIKFLLSIAVALGAFFYVFLFFRKGWKSEKNRRNLQLVTIGINILLQIGLLIIDLINGEDFTLRIIIGLMWILTLAVNNIVFYTSQDEQEKNKK